MNEYMSTIEIYRQLEKNYGDYEEGSEEGDVIRGLVSAASTAAGISQEGLACKLMLEVRDLVYSNLEWRVHEDGIDSLNEKELKLFRMGC
jgi:hypothetical protein